MHDQKRNSGETPGKRADSTDVWHHVGSKWISGLRALNTCYASLRRFVFALNQPFGASS